MGYIRKHRVSIRSAVEATTVLIFCIGMAPALILISVYY